MKNHNDVFFCSKFIGENTFEIFGSSGFQKAFINKNHTLNKRFNLSVFKDSQPADAVSNDWVIKSITNETEKFDLNCLDGLRALENSKLFDLINISMLSLELDSKLFIHNNGNLNLFKKQNFNEFSINY